MEYVYPPRPKGRITPGELGVYEQTREWVVQRKFNGDRVPIHVTPDRKVIFWNRHHKRFARFNASKKIVDQVLALNLVPGAEYWLDGELMNRTTESPYKDKIVLYDVLFAGRYLFGSPTLEERYTLLTEFCGNPTVLEPINGIALQISDDLMLAETWDMDFVTHFQEKIDLPEIEGLVLKKPKSVIDSLGTKEYEVTWQLRCRKPSKNYNH